MMERDTVPDAMLAAYQAAIGAFEDRLMAALDAAEAEGGDIRGRQSAAILVVEGQRGEKAWWAARTLEMRVEDHPEPLVELRRLVVLKRAYQAADRGEELHRKGQVEAGLAEMQRARSAAPDSAELAFWQAVALARSDTAAARALIARARATDPRWGELLRRLPAAGLFPDDKALIDGLLE